MAASTTPKPKPPNLNPDPPTPIPGPISFNTTGYPTPTKPPGTPTAEVLQLATSYEAYPSHAVLEFSIADLRFLGNVTDVRCLIFEMIFIDPKTAEVKELKLEITSPERKQLFLEELASEGCIQKADRTIHLFSLDARCARRAQHLFVPGNKFVVHAKVSKQIVEGKLQVAVRKYL
jgi:hypothetical protein